jgi:hypothetical protein
MLKYSSSATSTVETQLHPVDGLFLEAMYKLLFASSPKTSDLMLKSLSPSSDFEKDDEESLLDLYSKRGINDCSLSSSLSSEIYF